MARNGRILVADDDASLQRSVKRVAALHGYEVASAELGLEVVAMAARLQPELLMPPIGERRATQVSTSVSSRGIRKGFGGNPFSTAPQP